MKKVVIWAVIATVIATFIGINVFNEPTPNPPIHNDTECNPPVIVLDG